MEHRLLLNRVRDPPLIVSPHRVEGWQTDGALTLPNKAGPFPAIVLISGSANEYSGLRPGIVDLYMKDQAQNMVMNGFAVLRYDPPGVGLSTGDSRFETLNDRVQESMAALHYLQTRTTRRWAVAGLHETRL